MKKVLWISRHPLSDAQRAGLERICGGPFSLCWFRENVEQIGQLRAAALEADLIAAVLPPELLAQLVALAGERPVLLSRAKRTLIPTGGPEPAVSFQHGGWQRLRRLELELEPME